MVIFTPKILQEVGVAFPEYKHYYYAVLWLAWLLYLSLEAGSGERIVCCDGGLGPVPMGRKGSRVSFIGISWTEQDYCTVGMGVSLKEET